MGLNIQPVADHCDQENRFLIQIERFSESVLLSSFLPDPVNASFIVLARRRPPAPQSFDTRLPSTASRVLYCRNSLARGDSIRRHAVEQMISQDQRVKQNSSKMGDEHDE